MRASAAWVWELLRLVAELILGRNQFRLHLLVVLDELRHDVDDPRRDVGIGRFQIVVDLLDLTVVLVDIERHVRDQVLQADQNLCGLPVLCFALGSGHTARMGPKPADNYRPRDGRRQAVDQFDQDKVHAKLRRTVGVRHGTERERFHPPAA